MAEQSQRQSAALHSPERSVPSDDCIGRRRRAITTWYDYRDASSHIYAQRVSADGVPQWASDGAVLCSAANGQVTPAIISDGAGGAIVTWCDVRTGNGDIYAQRVNAAGVPQWTADGVALCTDARDQLNPVIVSDGAGGAIVAWQDHRSFTSYDIYSQRVDAAGVLQWTSPGVPVCTDKNSNAPSIVSDGAGGAIIAWTDSRSGNADIYSQRVSAAGTTQWTGNGVALCTAVGDQQDLKIVSDGSGGAVVTWGDHRVGPDGYSDIYAQRVNATGVPQWTADGVALCTAPNDQLKPAIASDGAGGVIVTWGDHRTGAAFGEGNIYAQRVDPAGVPLWTANGAAVCASLNEQLEPTIVSDGAGGAIVTWFDYHFASGYKINAQRMNAAGVRHWASNGVALCMSNYVQGHAAILSDGADGAIVIWEDTRSGSSDIYTQNIKSDGTLGGTTSLSVPPLSIAVGFALRSVQPNPSAGELQVSFSLLNGTPAALELFDLTGRRVESLSVGSLGPGAHVASLASRGPLPPGVYCVSLTQASRRAFSKVAIVR